MEEDEDSDPDVSTVNVDFEFFDPQPIDHQALQNLLRHLFDVDQTKFDIHSFADLILSQPLLGSTVKVDGKDSDPYAFLTVLNMNQHKNVSVIGELSSYVLQKGKSDAAFHEKLRDLLGNEAKTQTGLILSERLINMPTEVTPPMYKMLLEEIELAIEDREPYEFDYFLVFSKTYTESKSKLDEEEDRPKKKGKKAKAASKDVFYFHPEDEVFTRKASHQLSFPYSNVAQEADSRRTFQEFGVTPQGHLILLSKMEFYEAVSELETMYNPSS